VENNKPTIVRLGTRGSLLARMQSEWVAAELRRLKPGVQIELSILKTTGDRVTDRPLHDIGGKGLFTKELEQALLNHEIDFAVHSYKDVPVTMPLVDVSDLVIASVPAREDARDVLVAGPQIKAIDDLPRGSKVGTGSLRRQCQLLNQRPDLNIVPIRGNIDTRLRKQRDGEVDAVILAAAGLIRSNLFDATEMTAIPIQRMIPAAAQGALALQCRGVDESTGQLLGLINDLTTKSCTDIERGVIQMLNADCHSPIGVYARMIDVKNVEVQISIGKEGITKVTNLRVASDLKNVFVDIKKTLATHQIPS
jgi:hydroxymethylbilane synthase